ncbi:hemagglutinin repeat-containing protein [Variovorax sp. N23]|uniref:hemagglutinin repeat-containing protein n=1 Tax=Variovorax sp. N23 TaxID=2980555 RepID=UPI0021C86C58|nr:hemagglutinin repeat-containing protein [Variovorax sp. N23]MCU4118902.1 hemagglutinin repeat-containing protein [Variovorax sp. N23]
MAVSGTAAQTAPSAPQPFIEQQRQQDRERALREQQERAIDVRLPTAPERGAGRLPDAEAPCLRIDRLVLDGEHADGFQWLLPEAAGEQNDDSPLGRCLGTQGVNSVGAQNGVTIDLAAGSNRGTGSGSDSTNVNSYVTAANMATIKSGGNTTLDGAVVQAETVKAEVGGDLRIQSEQDTSTATANQSGGGFDASICYFWCYGTPVVAGGSVNTAGGKGRYASVTEQSGIQAGDGGFDVKVVGNTNLVGGVIASTDQAVDGARTASRRAV